MKIVLHVGAHRTAGTLLRQTLARAAARGHLPGVVLKGPEDRASEILGGRDRRAQRRIRGRIALHQPEGPKPTLLISDPGLMGPLSRTVRAGCLYPDMAPRFARLDATFEGDIACVTVVIRELSAFWASVLAVAVVHGHPVPSCAHLNAIAASPRSWRTVIEEVRTAMPDSRILVVPAEGFAARPEHLAALMLGWDVPAVGGRAERPAQAPDALAVHTALLAGGDTAGAARVDPSAGRWRPFSAEASARLKAAYDADIAWLRSGANGWAEYVEGATHSSRTGSQNGERDDRKTRRLGCARGEGTQRPSA